MMTNEELFASIYTHDTIYLPPSEQDCAALEVALGCSHAKCRFCDTDFVGADAGFFATAEELAQTIAATFPVLAPQAYGGRKPYIAVSYTHLTLATIA